ncbi:MAG: hypothetical protein JEY97_07285 [Bacteroidales bacterium]|nr:hypothetical protein [Bacteroidales bacterium]
MRKIILICFICLAGNLYISAQGKQSENVISDTSPKNVNEMNKDVVQDEVKTSNYSFTGYYNVTDLGFLVGSTSNVNKAPFSFLTVNGYQFTEQLGAGIGVGVEFFSESYLPLVLDARYYFREANFSPFAFVRGGYLFALEESANHYIYHDYPVWSSFIPPTPECKPKGGWIINPGLGIRNMFNEHFGIVFSAAYRFQSLHYEYNDDSKLILESNRLDLKIGIIFK